MVEPPATPRKQAPAQVGANAPARVLAPPPDLARYPSLAGKTVLVTHQPPFETLDMTDHGPAGSKSLR